MIRKYWLYMLGIPKTMIFNFWYFPLSIAVKLPVFVSHRVWFMELEGNVSISALNIRTGMIKLGFGKVGIFDQHRSRMVWQVSGKVEFNGLACIGHGSKIVVGPAGKLRIGQNFAITAESAIVAMESVDIGNDVLISWDTLVMDTDFHSIFDEACKLINPNAPIIIGNKVWIGCRSLILKGSEIPDGVVVAAASIVCKDMQKENSIIGGNPALLLKEKITWVV